MSGFGLIMYYCFDRNGGFCMYDEVIIYYVDMID